MLVYQYEAVIELSISNFDYSVFQEFYQWTFDTVVGSIGGAFGFWLGLDVFIIVFTLISKPALFLLGKLLLHQIQTQVEELTPTLVTTKKTFIKQLLKVFIPNKWNFTTWNFKNPAIIKWVVSRLIWNSLFIAGIALTVAMYVRLYQGYAAGGTQSVTTVMFNSTISLPPSALCSAISPIGFEFSKCNNEQECELFDPSILDTYLSQTNLSKTMFLKSQHHWPRQFTFHVFLYLRAVFLLEQGSPYSHLVIKGQDMYTYFNKSSDDYNSVLNETRDLLLNLSVTDEELQQKFAIEYAKLHNLSLVCTDTFQNKTVTLSPTTATIEVPEAGTHVFIYTSDSICLHYLTETFTYSGVYDRCTFSSTSGKINDLNIFYLVIKSSTAYKYLPDYVLTENSPVNMKFEYTSIYEKSQNCSVDNTPPLDCLRKCRVDIAAKLCKNCTILPNSSATTVPEECKWGEYSDCLRSIPNFTDSCFNLCLSPCTQTNFYFDTFINDSIIIDHRELIISVQNFIYPLMTEVPIMTSSDFFAVSGGLLGFWLGLDVTFLVSICFTPIMLLVGAFVTRRKFASNQPMEQTDETAHGSFVKNVFEKMFNISFFRMSKSLIIKLIFEKIFWAAIYAAFGVLTVKMCIAYIQQLHDNPKSSSMEKVLNQTITLPMTTFCVPLDYAAFNVSADISFIDQLNISIFDRGFQWPMPLLHVAQQYLSLVDSWKSRDELDSNKVWSAFAEQYGNFVRKFKFPQSSYAKICIPICRLRFEYHFNFLNGPICNRGGGSMRVAT